ncbi:hypothetical protein DJZ08_00285 [Streptococcus infantarius subsp. infantarius]|nr:hypothetical protein [Streptococcus infantarius subsp. infantarius]
MPTPIREPRANPSQVIFVNYILTHSLKKYNKNLYTRLRQKLSVETIKKYSKNLHTVGLFTIPILSKK